VSLFEKAPREEQVKRDADNWFGDAGECITYHLSVPMPVLPCMAPHRLLTLQALCHQCKRRF
jgi:hypothetical protein